MKKKQLFAVLLAGSMTVGMAPAAAFAAEDTGAGAAAAAEAQVTDDNTDNTDATDDSATADAEAQKQAEADAQAAAQAQAEAKAQAEAEAQKQAEEQAAAEAKAQAEAQAAEEQKQAEEQAAAEAEAEAQKQAEEQAAAEAEKDGLVVTSQDELKAAISKEDDLVNIIIDGKITLSETITIPAGKRIAIVGKDTSSVIARADGFGGTLFDVKGELYTANQDATSAEGVKPLTVDGTASDGTKVTGSLVHVEENATFCMTTGVTLKNNNSSEKGAAILNEGGKIILIGGTITGNKCDNGAVYSTGTISVKKGAGAADTEPSVTENKTLDGKADSNIVLSKGGNIEIISKIYKDNNGKEVDERITGQVKLGFSVEDPEDGYAAITNGTNEDIFKAALKILASQYEGDKEKFTVNETTGQLDSAQEPVAVPVVSIKSTKWSSGTTATAVITSDKAGTYHYICTANEDDSLTIDKCTESGEIKANKETEIKLSGLSGKTAYLYVWVDGDGTVSERQKAKIVLTESDTKKAPVITKANSKWNSHTAATVTISSDKAGQYYYKWVTKGSKAPKFNTSKKGTEIAANTNTEIKLTKLKEETAIDFYVCVKDSNGKVSKTKKISLNEAKRPANVKWVKFKWINHDSASLTFRSNFSGTCYYTWVERRDDGKPIKLEKDAIKTKQSINKDENFIISLNDLNTNKAVDLYLYIKPSKGTESGTKRIKLDQTKRPTADTPTPTPADNHKPETPSVTESIVKGLSTNMEFYPNTFYPFEVIGAGTTNSDPGEGDVKWEPLYWSTSANPEDKDKHSTWKIGSTKGISKGSKFSLYVFFQKWVYTGGKWTETDTISSARYEFGSVPITITPSAGAGANGANGSGGQTGSDPDATVTGAASATSANGGNGTTSRNAVSTADNSPIGTMSALAVASILAGGYVIVRRRKKDI